MEKISFQEIDFYQNPLYPRYYISKCGKVLSIKSQYGKIRHRLMKQKPDKYGYLTVCLTISPQKEKTVKVHRLVCTTFLENPENKETVNHKNGEKLDNRLENLEWTTILENNRHAAVIGKTPDRSNNASNLKKKLSKEMVIEIRSLSNPDLLEISKTYGITKRYIKRILNRTAWKNI